MKISLWLALGPAVLVMVACSADGGRATGDHPIRYAALPLDLRESKNLTAGSDAALQEANALKFARLWRASDYNARYLLDGFVRNDHLDTALGSGHPHLKALDLGPSPDEAISYLEYAADTSQLALDVEKLPIYKAALYASLRDSLAPNGVELKYNPAYSSLLSLMDKRVQSFAGASAFDWVVHRTLSIEEFRSQNHVMIFTPAHILPGYLTKNDRGDWELHGIEMTVQGKGHRYFGPTAHLAGRIIVVDADLFRVVHTLRNQFKSVAALRAARDFAVRETAWRYTIDLKKVDRSVFDSWNANVPKGAANPLAQTPFAVPGSVDAFVPQADDDLVTVDELPPETEAGHYTELSVGELKSYRENSNKLHSLQVTRRISGVGDDQSLHQFLPDEVTYPRIIGTNNNFGDWPVLAQNEASLQSIGVLAPSTHFANEIVAFFADRFSADEVQMVNELLPLLRAGNVSGFGTWVDTTFVNTYRAHYAGKSARDQTGAPGGATSAVPLLIDRPLNLEPASAHPSEVHDFLSAYIAYTGTKEILRAYMLKRYEMAADVELNHDINAADQYAFIHDFGRNVLPALILRAAAFHTPDMVQSFIGEILMAVADREAGKRLAPSAFPQTETARKTARLFNGFFAAGLVDWVRVQADSGKFVAVPTLPLTDQRLDVFGATDKSIRATLESFVNDTWIPAAQKRIEMRSSIEHRVQMIYDDPVSKSVMLNDRFPLAPVPSDDDEVDL